MEESSAVQLTRISSELLFGGNNECPACKNLLLPGDTSGISHDGRFDKTLMLETLSPKETAKIKTHAGMSRVHFGPWDPAGSPRLLNTVTATVPEDRQRAGWLLLLVLCCAQLPPSEVPLSCLQTRCFFFHQLMPQP